MDHPFEPHELAAMQTPYGDKLNFTSSSLFGKDKRVRGVLRV
jgi:hypothetical protein